MRWKGRRQSSNIEDRRGAGRASYLGGPRMRVPAGRGVRRGGGLGLVGLVVVGLFLWLGLGMNPLAVIALLGAGGGGGAVTGGAPYQPPAQQQQQTAGDDEMRAFVATVLAETEDTWNRLLPEQAGRQYSDPTLVLFTGSTRAACGFASAASGPFYCPADQKVYLDLAFFQELARQFGAPGDFAQAYVIAHEVGHHVQNQLGILGQAEQLKRRLGQAEANQVSVRVELQADCLAGIWANFADRDGLLEKGDVAEALNAARAVGDDTIQRRMQGYVVPETFNHGSAEQRQHWFTVGLQSGRLTDCDTFGSGSF